MRMFTLRVSYDITHHPFLEIDTNSWVRMLYVSICNELCDVDEVSNITNTFLRAGFLSSRNWDVYCNVYNVF